MCAASTPRPHSGARQWSEPLPVPVKSSRALAAAFVVSTNLFLRPVIQLINKQPLGAAEIETQYAVEIRCDGPRRGACPRVAAAGSGECRIGSAPADERKSRGFSAGDGKRTPGLAQPSRYRA